MANYKPKSFDEYSVPDDLEPTLQEYDWQSTEQNIFEEIVLIKDLLDYLESHFDESKKPTIH